MANDKIPFQQGLRSQGFFATKPTAFTRNLRTSLLWQLVRFVVINIRMIRIIRKSHG
jgi:hypothetical protein